LGYVASENKNMRENFPSNHLSTISIFLFSAASVFLLFLWQSHEGLSLLDEGFLWYGAQRVIAGEVPIRDFYAYDIGRYYWSAAFMGLLGNTGIISLRIATAVFQAIALFTGLTLLARNFTNQTRIYLLLAWVILVAWMAHQYRLYDTSLPILMVGVLAYLVEKPSTRRYFLSGLAVGLVAVFGRNHGVYGIAGSFGVLFYLAINRGTGPGLLKAFIYWASGVFTGYLPVLVFFSAVPGFALAFWEFNRYLYEIKATNLPLPIPWPWQVPFDQLTNYSTIRALFEGLFFIATLIFGLLGIVLVIRNRLLDKPVSPILAVSVFMALPYAHYAYSRADISHLAPGLFPFLLGILALLADKPAKIKWSFAIFLCGASLTVMLPSFPAWECLVTHQCVKINVAGDILDVDPTTAGNLIALSKLAKQFAPGDRTFIAAPFWPGAYAALGRKSPMWEIYVLFPYRSTTFQQAEIERIKAANPAFVLIHDFALDGREDLRFRNSRPLIFQYIRDNFEQLNEYLGNPAFHLYISKQPGQKTG